jgi:hypothetical protein
MVGEVLVSGGGALQVAGLRADVDLSVGGRGRNAVVGQPGYAPHHVLVAIEADCGGGGGGSGQGRHSERGGARRGALMRRANVRGGSAGADLSWLARRGRAAFWGGF